MINFVVHDADGNILRHGICPLELLEIQANREGETAIATVWPSPGTRYRVVGGEAVLIEELK